MTTEKKQFKAYLKKHGFYVNDITNYMLLAPEAKQDENGNKHLIDSIYVVLFSGCNTEDGDLGCVTFYYHGKTKLKHHRGSFVNEICKKAFCPKSVSEAIEALKIWQKTSRQKINGWKTLI